MIQTLTRR